MQACHLHADTIGDMTERFTTSHVSDEPSESRRVEAAALETGGTPRSLAPLFWLALHAPGLGRRLAVPATALALRASAVLRADTHANAFCIFGESASAERIAAYQRGVVRSFFDFVMDVGDAARKSPDELNASIEATEGESQYVAARNRSLGVIFLTGHIGSFEVGLARLARMEPRVQVVYKYDALAAFEGMRRALRERLNVRESPIDRGLDTWISLRDGLMRGEAVVMQGDRAVPGQPSQTVRLLHGLIRLPVGAFKLARLTGSAVVPVFTARVAPGRFRIVLFPAITCESERVRPGELDPAVVAFARALESMILRYPEQWLVLRRAFEKVEPSRQGA